MIGTLFPISTLKQQLTDLEQTYIRCPLYCEWWTVKARDCASVFHSFRKNTYRTDEWRKQLLRLKSWAISGSPEQWMGFQRLWWTVVAYKCSYLFQLFNFYCLLVQNLLFYWKFTLLLLFFDYFEWKVKVHQQIICTVPLPETIEVATYLSILHNFILP